MAPSSSEKVRNVLIGFDGDCIALDIKCPECGQRTTVATFCLHYFDARYGSPSTTPPLFCNPCGKMIVFRVVITSPLPG
jgi:ribosomal protein S27E